MTPTPDPGANVTAATFSVSWQELHRLARDLARALAPRGPFQGIVAVTRGGLVPAAIVARELGLRVIDTISIASYDDRTQGTVQVLKPVLAPDFLASGGAGVLAIDDLADTGATARTIRRALPAAIIATVYAKPAGRDLVDLFAREVPQDTWILFPWDLEP